MIGRATFLQGLAATTVATGGLDLPDATPQIRVLVSGDVRGEIPRVSADGTFRYDGRVWRGAPSTVGLPDGRVALVTTIGIDAYLQGVIPLEASPSWPFAALAVQAIVARTFALARRTLSRPYDVRADDADQHWGGVEAEAPQTNAAVDATRGQTLSFGGGPAEVFYSACCGGHTADIAAVWGGDPLAYLRGVSDPYCTPAPDYRWTRGVPLQRVLAVFGAQTGGTLQSAAPAGFDDSGRPRTVLLNGTLGAAIPIADFRRALGYDVVRSSWIRALRVNGTTLEIDGNGRGHGVGLCQWGARYFAAAGAGPAEILRFYFPGTSLAGG